MPRTSTPRDDSAEKTLMTLMAASSKKYNLPTKPIVGHVLITVSADGVIDVTAGGVLHNQLDRVIKALRQ